MKRKYKLKYRYLILLVAWIICAIIRPAPTQATECPDVRFVFARGSGGERWNDKNYLEFKSRNEEKISTTDVKYDFIDLDYPAVSVGLENLGTTIGAYVGAGNSYEFGESVASGVENLKHEVNNNICPDTKFVLGGYSQGAMVISKSLPNIDAKKIIYAATFGDPKIYLPEGWGPLPVACFGGNMSSYRMYVPDCRAHKGLLGGLTPYQPDGFEGKLGTWCNKMDIFCSAHFNVNNHTSYVEDNLYEDASRIIFDKIAKHFGFENKVTSPHDTAILIDSTGSMSGLIKKYKAEALRLAKETLESGGRVALFDYRDLDDPYMPVEHCNFETCTLDVFADKLEKIKASGGGDTLESTLSASFYTMKALKWKHGATKSLVILTDSGYLAPDRDGMNAQEVVRLSKMIDPVNFYIITTPEQESTYSDLAIATDGKVVTDFDELHLLTDYIMQRYDSLPRVEEGNDELVLPTLNITRSIRNSDTEYEINYNTDADSVAIMLNDMLMGVTKTNQIIANELKPDAVNTIAFVPIKGNVRGETVLVTIPKANPASGGEEDDKLSLTEEVDFLVPKAPKTGRR